MVSIRTLVAALIVFANRTAVGAGTNADVFVEHQVATQTFEADLRQAFHWTFPPRHVESLGHLSYRAPESLAIVFTNPAPELVVVHGDQLYIKRDTKRLAKYKLEVRNGKPTQNVQFLLGFFQNGCTNFAGLFDVSVATSNDVRTVTLTPKHRMQMFPLRSVDNVIGWPSMDVRSMRIGLIMGSYIVYEFHNSRRNEPIDDSIFEVPTR